nr:hypothetical protein [Rickettsia endosymbiont of Ceutorhynchus assimilis]
MKNKITKLYNKEISPLLAISTFITLIMWVATKHFLEPSFTFIFNYVSHNIASDNNIEQMIKYWNTNEPVNIQIIMIFIGIDGFILTHVYMFTSTLISAYAAFKSVSSTIILRNFKLKHDFSFINEIKLIATWVFLYSWGNLLLQLFDFPHFVYTKLAIVCQGIVFFFLIYNRCFGFQLQKRTKPIKY